jgi:hypothetical protein
MPTPRIYPALLAFLLVPATLFAQAPPGEAPLSSAQIALACAPPAAYVEGRPPSLRVLGAQDTVARGAFDDHDLLIVGGGTTSGLRLGQQLYVRRPVRAPNYAGRWSVRHPIHTTGWVRIVATNDGTAIALVEHACDAITAGDYLEPFTPPSPPQDFQRAEGPSNLDFRSSARVVFGDVERMVVAPGEFLFIDRGAGHGVQAGARFAIYRDVQKFVPEAGRMRSAGLPLAAIGEGVVVSSGPSTAVVQLVTSRDAVQVGDIAVPRR